MFKVLTPLKVDENKTLPVGKVIDLDPDDARELLAVGAVEEIEAVDEDLDTK